MQFVNFGYITWSTQFDDFLPKLWKVSEYGENGTRQLPRVPIRGKLPRQIRLPSLPTRLSGGVVRWGFRRWIGVVFGVSLNCQRRLVDLELDEYS